MGKSIGESERIREKESKLFFPSLIESIQSREDHSSETSSDDYAVVFKDEQIKEKQHRREQKTTCLFNHGGFGEDSFEGGRIVQLSI